MGCRTIADQHELVRFTTVAGELREGRTLPGRGAWCHPDRACFTAGADRGGFARALRAPVSIPVDLKDEWPRSA